MCSQYYLMINRLDNDTEIRFIFESEDLVEQTDIIVFRLFSGKML